jgi:hypothetical protein
MTPATWLSGLLLAVAGLLSGCLAVQPDGSADASAAAATPLATPAPAASQASLSARGKVVSEAAFELPDETVSPISATAAEAVYLSTSGVSGDQTRVGGAFFLPAGSPPADGWPVLAWAHGTTGISHGCAPSALSDLGGDATTVGSFVAAGFAVAVTDYEGLGDVGEHPYLEPRTAAYNVIDSVRALRNLYPTVGTRWVAIGPSQGGQAAWAVNELNKAYGSGLDLLGTVALSPAVELSALADRAMARTLTDSQLALLPLVVVGLSRYDPAIHANRFLRGRAAAAEGAHGCGARPASGDAGLPNAVDVGPASIRDENDLRDGLRRIALPKQPLSAPMLVVNGLRDDMVAPDWISVAVKRSCRMGGVIAHVEMPTAGHNDLGGAELIARWIGDRFAGVPPPSTCETS